LFLLCGLGNKGPEYKHTRHNIGYLTVDRFAERFHVPVNRKLCGCRTGTYEDVLLAKPDTYMNLSGGPVASLMKKMNIKAEDLLLVQDDLDMSFGRIKIKWSGRDGGHKGVRSVIDALQTPLFYRLKIGIGRDTSMAPEDYVLSSFGPAEKGGLIEALDTAVDAIHTFLFEGKEKAMSMYNRGSVV
jgi:peptidyl-tRNA hydrolase, PTH1 family